MAAINESPLEFPRQTKFIVGNEVCERFGYYGMRSILVVFMLNTLRMHQQDAEAVYHLFVAGVYLLPLLGAYLSDRILGKYYTIFTLSIVYCLGHLSLALWETKVGLYFGLSLIALGAGGIKPCVSAFVGDQFSTKNESLLKKVFDLFYWTINFGAFFSTLLIPFVLVRWGSKLAFGIPGILMVIATLIFWFGRKQYVHISPTTGDGVPRLMPIVLYAIRHRSAKQKGQNFLDVARTRFPVEAVEAAQSVVAIIKVFATVSIFWALYDQNASSWVLQAQKMDLNCWGIHLEAAQLQALNPILVMLLIPFFGVVIYPAIERCGIRLTPLRKMATGMVLAGFSFVVVGVLQTAIDSGWTVSVMWQMIPYLILTCAEIMISITGLEFAYTQAPKSMKSTIMSFWLLTVFVGNLLDATIAELNVFQGAMYFYFFAGLMFLVSIIFICSAARYRVRTFAQSESQSLVPATSV